MAGKTTPRAGSSELMTEDMSFLDGMDGQGLDAITSKEQAVGYLSMV